MMVKLSARIRSKPKWWKKYTNPRIRARWHDQMINARMVWNGQAFVSGIGGEKMTASSSLGDGRESDIEMRSSMRRRGDNKNAEGFEHEHGYSTVKLDEDGIDARSGGRERGH